MPRIGSKLQLSGSAEGMAGKSRWVIGIDPSATATGLVRLNVDTLETIDYCIRPKNTGPQRLEEIYFQTRRFVENIKPVHICMEDYAFSPLTASQSHKLGEVGGVIKLGLWMQLNNWPTLVTNNQAKKFCLGRGGGKDKITKAQLLKGVYTKWGFDTNDDNIADAYIEARIARALILQNTDMAYEKEVITALMTPTKKGNRTIPARFMAEAPVQVREDAILSLTYGNTSSAAIGSNK